jgi:hypothetical protein
MDMDGPPPAAELGQAMNEFVELVLLARLLLVVRTIQHRRGTTRSAEGNALIILRRTAYGMVNHPVPFSVPRAGAAGLDGRRGDAFSLRDHRLSPADAPRWGRGEMADKAASST